MRPSQPPLASATQISLAFADNEAHASLGRLVVGGDLVLAGRVIGLRHAFGHGTGTETETDRQCDRFHVDSVHVVPSSDELAKNLANHGAFQV
jgi:hypothetical protein